MKMEFFIPSIVLNPLVVIKMCRYHSALIGQSNPVYKSHA